MKHILELDYDKNENLERLFKTISEGNGILFLGAGASVSSDKRFLSKDIIEFYEDRKGISWGISDIVEFVDALSSNKNFSRDEFDEYVDELLRKYQPTSAHRAIARIAWRIIITTNYDLLVEKAFAEIEGTVEEVGALKEVLSPNQYYSITAKNEIKYVKLHGCISDKRKYNLVFSTDDFKRVAKFYKSVLDDLKNLSDSVSFISAGYSYSDDFAKKLLEKIDSYNFRSKRIIYNIDPFVNEALLPKYEANNICIIKAGVEEFFAKYEEWKSERDVLARPMFNNNFKSNDNNDLFIPNHIKKRVGFNLRQLNGYFSSRIMPNDEFYKGGEPDYNVILKNYDVVKSNKLAQVKEEIFGELNNGASHSRLIPLFFLTGTFGTGKSTFAYRLINKLNQSEFSVISFEIYDPFELKSIDLKEIFSKSNANYIFLYINNIEINSVFRALLELRNRLSIEVSPETKIVILATIRENILLKYREDKEIKNSFAINVDCPFNREEVIELLDKLKNSGVVAYRDAKEKLAVENKIFKDFSGDSFVSLLELVQGNKLIEDLLQAYYQLNEKCKKAFLYTSLLYQHKILMPSGLLQSLVSTDWEQFRSEVIEKDGKGILIQEIVDSKGTDPDLYFRTKHPIISKKLIENLLRDEDSRFNYIKSIITHIVQGGKSTRLVIDFLKALITNRELTYSKIDTLYDLADEHLSEDPFFLLHYSINLQHRKTEESINKAISKIQYAESISKDERRNHFLIHRRGVLNFELAKIIFKRNDSSVMYKVYRCLDEAKDFFEIKRSLDPFSSYSYSDLLMMELWILEKIEEDPSKKLQRRIYFEEVMDIGLKTVFENVSRLHEINSRYVSAYKFSGNPQEYIQFLQGYYGNSQTRPYAVVLLFNHYLASGDQDKCDEYLDELENMTLNKDVLTLLLKYYGRNLANPNIRMKFFDIIKANPELEEYENLRFNYFNFIAECYSRNFKQAYRFLSNIRETYNHINPDFHQVWVDYRTNESTLFEAVLKYNKNRKKQFYIPDLNLWVKSENWNRAWAVGTHFDIELHFYIYGLKARAVNIISEEYEEESEDYDNSKNNDIEL